MSLASVGNRIWNDIAKTQKLRTAWARMAFKLNGQEMAELEDAEYLPLKKLVGSEVAYAYIQIRPLLMENAAIRAYVRAGHQDLEGFLPNVVSVREAIAVIAIDIRLTSTQQDSLRSLLRTDYIDQIELQIKHLNLDQAEIETAYAEIDDALNDMANQLERGIAAEDSHVSGGRHPVAKRLNNILRHEKSHYVLPVVAEIQMAAGGMFPVDLVLDAHVGTETVLMIVDRTSFVFDLAKVRPSDLRLKTGLVRTSNGPLFFVLFCFQDPNNPDIVFSAFDVHVNPHNPQHRQYWRNLSSQTHWHLVLVGGGDNLVGLIEFENTYAISQILDRLEATCQPKNDEMFHYGMFDYAKAEFCDMYAIEDLLEL